MVEAMGGSHHALGGRRRRRVVLQADIKPGA